MASLFNDFLTALGVKHTEDYSDTRFYTMPFQTMFGLSHLLGEYGVGTMGITVAAPSRAAALEALSKPFLADTQDGFLIVTKVSDGNVTYESEGRSVTATVGEVAGMWNGIALLAAADSDAREPDYLEHHIAEMAKTAKVWVLWGVLIALAGYAMWASHLYSQWCAWPLLVLDLTGVWLSWMLVQKALGVRNKTADAVCSALEEGGCDEIAQSAASSFMGIFKWSEVGLAYFSVSLLSMLLFPQTLPALAAINILCLPYTVWSIVYQKFVAKTWCTLCVCVQATLWALFIIYLLGGCVGRIFPLRIDIAVLCGSYVAVLLALNRLDGALSKHILKKTQQ